MKIRGKNKWKQFKNQIQVKTIKKYDHDAEDAPFISKQNEIFNELVDERLEKITDLDKKVNSDDLIYRYKGNIADVKFGEFDNALDIIDKIRDGKKAKLKYYLGEIKKGNKNIDQKCRKTLCTILKCFTKQETKLLNFMMIILQWCLRQNIEQLKEQGLRY